MEAEKLNDLAVVLKWRAFKKSSVDKKKQAVRDINFYTDLLTKRKIIDINSF